MKLINTEKLALLNTGLLEHPGKGISGESLIEDSLRCQHVSAQLSTEDTF